LSKYASGAEEFNKVLTGKGANIPLTTKQKAIIGLVSLAAVGGAAALIHHHRNKPDKQIETKQAQLEGRIQQLQQAQATRMGY
jgi:tartrate dehydratase beta subunit/fumarate hydratase class I family protein